MGMMILIVDDGKRRRTAYAVPPSIGLSFVFVKYNNVSTLYLLRHGPWRKWQRGGRRGVAHGCDCHLATTRMHILPPVCAIPFWNLI
jgi:hypothetical protein